MFTSMWLPLFFILIHSINFYDSYDPVLLNPICPNFSSDSP
jgi:hypothetical protein